MCYICRRVGQRDPQSACRRPGVNLAHESFRFWLTDFTTFSHRTSHVPCVFTLFTPVDLQPRIVNKNIFSNKTLFFCEKQQKSNKHKMYQKSKRLKQSLYRSVDYFLRILLFTNKQQKYTYYHCLELLLKHIKSWCWMMRPYRRWR